jgi:hypothetical protein
VKNNLLGYGRKQAGRISALNQYAIGLGALCEMICQGAEDESLQNEAVQSFDNTIKCK